MPRRNEYTFVIERPLSHSRAAFLAKQLTENTARQEGYATSAVPRELRTGEAYEQVGLAYMPSSIQAVS